MIATKDLIQQLAADARPLRKGAASLGLVLGVAAGALVSFAAIASWLGWPLTAVPYTGVPAFLMKLAFSVSMLALAGVFLLASGRPGRHLGKRLSWLLLPPALVFVAAAMELTIAAPQFREDAWLGSTWLTCILSITALSIPVLAGITWAFRRLAPTNLPISGFLAGVTSGSAAAVVYALYCPETTATFLASWYTLGILTAGVIGSATATRLLRW